MIVLSEYYGLTPDVYISPTGDDSTGAGTDASPWATTTKAIAETTAGQIIGFKDGTYTWADGDLDMDADRTFVGQSFLGVVIDASAAASSPTYFYEMGSGGSNVDIINIRFTGVEIFTSNEAFPVFANSSGLAGLLTYNQCVFNNILFAGDQQRMGSFFGAPGGNGVSGDLNVKTVSCIMYDLNGSSSGSDEATVFSVASQMDSISYEHDGLTLILTNTGTDQVLNIYGTQGLSATETAKHRNCVFANYTGLTTDLKSGNDIDTDNSIYYDFANTGTLGANDSTSDPKLIDPEFTSLTDPDDIKLAFRPQTISPAIGAGVAT